MDALTYALCALAASWCAVRLLAAWRGTGVRLLLWCGLCFAGLTLNNVLLVLDRTVLVDRDLSAWRQLAALAAITVMIVGLVMETDR